MISSTPCVFSSPLSELSCVCSLTVGLPLGSPEEQGPLVQRGPQSLEQYLAFIGWVNRKDPNTHLLLSPESLPCAGVKAQLMLLTLATV